MERILDEKYASGKEDFFTLLSREKWDEAARQLERLRQLVTAGGEYVKPQQREEPVEFVPTKKRTGGDP